MNKKLLVAALVAPSVALSFNPAWAGRSKHHRHYSQQTYASGKTAPSNKPTSSGRSSKSQQEGGANASPESDGPTPSRDRGQEI